MQALGKTFKKNKKHISLPSADAWHSAKGPSPWPGRHGGFSLSSAVVALGKSFAECPTCGTRQRSLCHEGICRQLFAMCSTRQRLCRVQSLLYRVQLHSAKKVLHSTKPLSSAALGKELSAYPFTAKDFPSATTALGKEKPSWWPGHGDGPFAECHASALGKEMCFLFFLKNFFAECLNLTLGKSCFLFFCIFFAECLDHGTRQSWEA